MHDGLTTFLFTDLEGSTRLWEAEPERMRPALARHDALARAVVEAHRGRVVKMTGDGVHAAFTDPLDAIDAAIAFQEALGAAEAEHGIALRVRCGLHCGDDERREGDFFGTAVNRAARIMGAAHGGQVLVSRAIAERVGPRLRGGASLRDLGVVRLRDLAEPERVYQIVHPKLRADFPALRSLAATPNNLPQQLTSFIGREQVLSEARTLLAGTRLLSLVGAGGLGKTRLSLQLAASVLDDFVDGVWFVELAPLRDAALIAHAIASVLHVKEDPGKRVLDALIAHLRERTLLIVLDNCEHVLAGCADVAKALLQGSPNAKVLTSSREALHVPGEITLTVPALAAPAAGATASAASLGAFESARLFVDRAAAALPGFTVDASTAPAIAEICRRLDGIPLALELAAARVRVLSVDDIAQRLAERFTLLRSRDSTALPRQQTLRALIDWSYDLLAEDERMLFGRLAVFAGSFTLDAAERVGAGGRLAADDVLDTLARLVEKSLVVHDAHSGRYRLLETMRQYAQERLDETGDGVAARARHLVHYVELAERARPQLTGPDQARWLSRLDAELDNLLAAHAYADTVADGARLGLRLTSAVRFYLINRGLLRLGRRITLQALDRPGAQAPDLARCRGLFDAGQLEVFMGRYAEGRAHLAASLAIARDLGDQARVAMALQPLSMAAIAEGDAVAARAYAEEGVTLARAQNDRRELAAALNALAQLERVEGRLGEAEALYGQFLALARELGDRESIGIALLNLAMVAVDRGRLDDARAMLREVLAITRDTASKASGLSMIDVSAALCACAGDAVAAVRYHALGERLMREFGIQRDASDEAFLRLHIARARAALDASAQAAAEAAADPLGYDAAIADVAAWLEAPGETVSR